MIPYEELAAALEGNRAPADPAASASPHEDSTLSGSQLDPSTEYEIGEENISEES